jgi:hypothetical protein
MLGVADREIDLTQMRAIAGWDDARQRLDVRLWHPAFDGLSEDDRQQIGFLFLDNLLGEDDVERWIGTMESSSAEFAGRTPQELSDEVRRRAGEAPPDSWVLAERTGRGGDLALVSANAALKRIDHPFASHHLCVTVDRGLEQLSQSPELPELDKAEEDLMEELRGTATAAGRVTERRRRMIHYVCADAQGAAAIAEAWARRHGRFGIRVEVRSDPSWSFRKELLGS